MPRRLVIPVIACLVSLGLAGSTASADVVAPVRGLQLQSPAHFVLPKQPVRIPLGVRAVRLAQQQLGVPYRWGGSSPSGFDCSGLVSYVYGRVGISIPHNAAQQYRFGTPVSREQLIPGDLVFFDRLRHNGIYLGDGRFVHATTPGGVKIARLDDDWFRQRWVGARRL